MTTQFTQYTTAYSYENVKEIHVLEEEIPIASPCRKCDLKSGCERNILGMGYPVLISSCTGYRNDQEKEAFRCQYCFGSGIPCPDCGGTGYY